MPTKPTKAQLRAMPKKQRREVARELARQERITERRRLRRRTIARRWLGGLLAVGVVAGAVFAGQQWAKSRNRGPANMASDGIELTGAESAVYAMPTEALAVGQEPVATIPYRDYGLLDAVLYVDYSDPDAATLWSTAGEELSSELVAGAATVEIHPIAPDGSGPAVRAAAAMACVAEFTPDSALDAHEALLTEGAVQTADAVLSAFNDVGIDSEDVAGCVTSGRFSGWVDDATSRAQASVPFDVGSVSGTTLLLAGSVYEGGDDADAFSAALDEARAVVAEAYAAANPDATTDPTTDMTTGVDPEPTPGATTDGTSGG